VAHFLLRHGVVGCMFIADTTMQSGARRAFITSIRILAAPLQLCCSLCSLYMHLWYSDQFARSSGEPGNKYQGICYQGKCPRRCVYC